MAKYILLKVSSGEEIVGQLAENTDGSIKNENGDVWIKSPRMLVMQPAQGGGVGIAILPYSAGAPEGEHKFVHHHIVSTCPIPDKLERAYIENTSNIQIVAG